MKYSLSDIPESAKQSSDLVRTLKKTGNYRILLKDKVSWNVKLSTKITATMKGAFLALLSTVVK